MKLSETEIVKLGLLLQSKRRNLDLTLDQVKEKLLELGLVANTSDIIRLERGERKIPNAILLKNLCKIYGLDVITLFQEIGYLDIEKMRPPKIKVYACAKDAIESPENYLGEIELNLKNVDAVFAINTNPNCTVLVDKDKKVENNQKGIFELNNKYCCKKKNTLSDNEFILLGDETEAPVIVKEGDNCKEIGKIVGKIILE